MATQDGLIKLKGTIGDLTFFKSADGSYQARRKTGVNGDRVRFDPRFERTRENMAEFSRAGKASKLIRKAIATHLVQIKDRRMSNRLLQALVQVIKADAVNLRGGRNMRNGEAPLLKGFEFNGDTAVSQTLNVQYVGTIDRASGSMTVSVPAFQPKAEINAPFEATHCKLKIVALEADFENRTYVTASAESDDIALTNQPHDEVVLSAAVTPDSTHPLFLLFGISFQMESHGQLYALKNGEFNGLSVLGAESAVIP
jgi:hypothetical protein